MSKIDEAIRVLATSGSNEQRRKAEEFVYEYRATNSNAFLMELITGIGERLTDPTLIQAAAAIIKDTISTEKALDGDNSQITSYWRHVSIEIRKELRNACLDKLVSESDAIKTSTADLISAIFILEFPSDDCSNLLNNLAANSSHSDINIQRSAMMTLGYICEKMAFKRLQLSSVDSHNVISAISGSIQSTQPNDSIKKTGFKALQDSLPLLGEFFKTESIRDYILTQILLAFGHNSDSIVLQALQCLRDTLRYCYPYLSQTHAKVVLENVLRLAQKKQPAITIAVLEFLDSLARLEKKMIIKKELEGSATMHNFTEAFAEMMVTLPFELLLEPEKEEFESGLSVHSACVTLLTSVNELAFKAVKDPTIEYISKAIEMEAELTKQAALRAFEAAILGANMDISDLVEQSSKNIINLLKYSPAICQACLRVMEAMAERYPFTLIQDNICIEWLETAVQIMQKEPALGKFASLVFYRLGSEWKKYPGTQHGSYFQSKAVQLVKFLFDIALNPDVQRLGEYVQDVFVALMGVINCVNTAPAIAQITDYVAEVVEGKVFGSVDKPHVLGFYEGLSGVIMQVVAYGGRTKTPPAKFDDHIKTFYKFAIQQCLRKDIGFCDGLTLLPVLIRTTKVEQDGIDFDQIIQICAGALKESGNLEVMSAGIETVGYLCLMYPHRMAEHIGPLFSYTVDHLKNRDLNRKIRCQLMTLAGNLSLASKQELLKRIDEMLGHLRTSFEIIAAIFSSNSSESDKLFAKTLRRTCIEFVLLTVHGICFQTNDRFSGELQEKIKEFLPLLFEFVHRMLDEDMEPDIVDLKLKVANDRRCDDADHRNGPAH